jgi:hypothetical protein
MSRSIRLCTLLCACLGLASAQESRDAVRQRVETRRADVERSYRAFADRSLAAAERLRAVESVGAFATPAQIDGAIRIFSDAGEPPEVRAAALRRIPNLDADERVLADVLRVLSDRAAPRELRIAGADVVQRLMISSPTMRRRRPELLGTLRRLTDDPDAELRERAFTVLTSHGDDFASQRLIDGLRVPERAVLPPEKSARLLAQNPHGDHRGVFLAMLRRPPNQETEVEMIRGLGGFWPARDALAARARDPSLSKEVRSAALQSMLSTDKTGFMRVAIEVVEQEQSPSDVRALAIDGIGVARQTPGVAFDGVRLDRAMKSALDSGPPTIRRSAWNALKQSDPRFLDYAGEAAEKERDPALKSQFRSQLDEIRIKVRDVAPTRPTRPPR